jgi:putative nucleotidyltransferase with HDIG domain
MSSTSTTESAISCQIVAALTSALAYRDAATAEHSRRVADLCVRLAREIMPLSACYMLENAALLHDVGKIGVPDFILLKPGPLAENEWSIMRSHDQMGVDIIRSTFACEQLTQIVMFHHIPFDGAGSSLGVPVGSEIPLGARILAVCDAYDAMITDRVFRPGIRPDEAFVELRRCAGTQFDPEIVERFIGMIRDSTPPQGIDTSHVSKPAALRLGVQIESLARAIDSEDIAALKDLTCVVRETAQEFQIPQVESLANSLMAAIEARHEWVATVRLTFDLMEMCRQTQRTHLATLGQPAMSRSPVRNR